MLINVILFWVVASVLLGLAHMAVDYLERHRSQPVVLFDFSTHDYAVIVDGEVVAHVETVLEAEALLEGRAA